jgi:quinol-cytochrome oxidoreductase complex cytochrome b subunit
MKLIALIIIIFFYTNNAYAYLDPGSGSILVQALLFILAGLGTFFVFTKNKIKSLFKKLFKKKQKT